MAELDQDMRKLFEIDRAIEEKEIYELIRSNYDKANPLLPKIRYELISKAETLNLNLSTIHSGMRLFDKYHICTELTDGYPKNERYDSDDERMFVCFSMACLYLEEKFEEANSNIASGSDIRKPQDFYQEASNLFLEEVDIGNRVNYGLYCPSIWSFLQRLISVALPRNHPKFVIFVEFCYYLSEISLLTYHLLKYKDSVISSAIVFIAKYVVLSSMNPWGEALVDLSMLQKDDLADCVRAISRILGEWDESYDLVRDKYTRDEVMGGEEYDRMELVLRRSTSVDGLLVGSITNK